MKRALVTGASSGIGAALVTRLRRDGWEVVAAARREAELARLAASTGAVPEVLDVTDTERVIARIRALDAERPLDLVVANAGIATPRWSGALELAEVERVLDVNVRGAVATLLAPVEAMVSRGRGHLVGVTSMAALRGMPHNAVYGASKAFLRTFLQSLRVDLAPAGVDVTEVRPGFVRTPMTETLDTPTPFAVDACTAADVIARGIDKRAAVVAFPRSMAYLTHTLAALPEPVFARAARAVRPPLDREPPTDPT